MHYIQFYHYSVNRETLVEACGDSAITEALCAVAVAVYPDVDPAKLYVHRAHN